MGREIELEREKLWSIKESRKEKENRNNDRGMEREQEREKEKRVIIQQSLGATAVQGQRQNNSRHIVSVTPGTVGVESKKRLIDKKNNTPRDQSAKVVLN